MAEIWGGTSSGELKKDDTMKNSQTLRMIVFSAVDKLTVLITLRIVVTYYQNRLKKAKWPKIEKRKRIKFKYYHLLIITFIYIF